MDAANPGLSAYRDPNLLPRGRDEFKVEILPRVPGDGDPNMLKLGVTVQMEVRRFGDEYRVEIPPPPGTSTTQCIAMDDVNPGLSAYRNPNLLPGDDKCQVEVLPPVPGDGGPNILRLGVNVQRDVLVRRVGDEYQVELPPPAPIDRDPHILPRVGDEYQAEIPPFAPRDRASYRKLLVRDKNRAEISPLGPRDRDPNLLPRIGIEYQAEIPPFAPRNIGRYRKPLVGDENQAEISPLGPRVRDPNLLPRVGNEYQAEIPLLLRRDWYINHTEIPTNEEIRPGTPQSFLVGLPVLITWISEENEHKPPEFTDSSNSTSNGKGEGKPVPVPGSMRQRWTDVEESGFLLGLYTFGKNLFQVIRLLGGKSMEEIQSFYYGKFYRSTNHRRWSEGCREKSRRCIYGHKIFTGWRQQELLSRLLPRLARESKSSMLEVAKAFGEGKMALEDYVIALKDLVGLKALVEAVGIGKGKQDLTGLTMETPKSNQAGTIRPEIPTRKASNSLTPQEIVNFLTGGFRLSKARSHDLFWEAVWPRLLARGWHSEQPKDYFPIANRQSLVFLIPGIKKFSKRRLVKGDHYFDCVKDVLNKVASDPSLLELDGDTNVGEDVKREDFSDQRCRFYLKPRNTVRSTDAMRFTVIDTSPGGGGTNMVRELRSLPIEAVGISASSNSDESDEDAFEDATNHSRDINRPGASESRKNHAGNSFHEQIVQTAPSQSGLTVCSELTAVRGRPPFEPKVAKFADVQPREAGKDRTIQRIKPDSRNTAAPVEQCHQATPSSGPSCSERRVTNSRPVASLPVEVNNFRIDVDRLLQEMRVASLPVEVINNGIDVDRLLQEMIMSTSPPVVRNGQRPSSSPPCTAETSGKKPHLRTLFDMHAAPGSEDIHIEAPIMETTRRSASKPENVAQSAAMPVCDNASDQPMTTFSRRQGTRNRPPTARALEALASGLLSPPSKRKSKNNILDNSTARRLRRAPKTDETVNAATTNNKEIERGDSGSEGEGGGLLG